MNNNKNKKTFDLSNMNQKEIFLIIRKILGSINLPLFAKNFEG